MSHTIGTLLGAVEPYALTATNQSIDAYNAAYTATMRGRDQTAAALYEARQKAIKAWHEALPRLTTRRHIHAYIACIAVGQEQNVITGRHARELLYAAQLALTALTKRPGRKQAK